MPRYHDFTKSNSVEDVAIDHPGYGLNEIPIEQLNAENEVIFMGRNAQFSNTWKHPFDEYQGAMNGAFAWLSDNTTGPWFWHESWSNNGHTLGVHVHIERLSDQAVFEKTWAHAFEYRPDKDYDLEKLAVVKGILPAQPALFKWLGEHKLEYDLNHREKGANGEDVRKVLVGADTPEKAALFQKHWGHLFKPFIPPEPKDGAQLFVGDTPSYETRIIPADFRDYLEGKCDFTVVQVLPPVYDVNAGLPSIDLACK